jgi:hypothetical protein
VVSFVRSVGLGLAFENRSDLIGAFADVDLLDVDPDRDVVDRFASYRVARSRARGGKLS